MASQRSVDRIASWIHRKVATMFIRDFNDPRIGMLTVTRVDVSKDLETATIFYSVMSGNLQRDSQEESRAQHMLDRSAGYVQRAVAEGLHTRTVPKIHFEFDTSTKGAMAMTQLINKLTRERLERERADNPDGKSDDDGPNDDRNSS